MNRNVQVLINFVYLFKQVVFNT